MKAKVMHSRGDGFLQNGRVAWEMPDRIGSLYLNGRYMSPEGWSAEAVLDASWEKSGVYIVRKALPPPRKEVAVGQGGL